MFIVDESYLDRTVDLTVGQEIELRLKENPTTGFRWSFTSDGRPNCEVLSDSFDQAKGPPGSGGQHTWHVRASSVGTCDLELLYRRSFEPGVPPSQAFRLHVTVGK